MTRHLVRPRMVGSEEHPQAPLLRREFRLDTDHGALVSANWRVSAHGVVEASINGTWASDDVLSPGWSSYEWRLRYRELRRHRPRAGRRSRRRAGTRARQRLVPRPARLEWAGRSTATELGAIAELDDRLRRRPPAGRRSPTSPGRAGPSRGPGQRPVRRRRRSTPGALATPGSSPASPTRPGAGVAAEPFDTDDADPVRRAARRPARGGSGRSRSGRHRPGKTLVDFGQNLVGWLQLHRTRRRRSDDHGAARRGAGARRARHPSAADGRGHRPVHPQRRRRRLRADLDVPRLPVRRGRRLARRADAATRWSRSVVVTPTCGGSATSSAPTTCSTSCTATWSGGSAATSSTCRPTARSATSGSAGPATSRSSRRPPPTCFDVERVPARLAARPRRRAGGRRRAWCPSSSRTSSSTCEHPADFGAGHHRDLERRGGLGAVGAAGRRTATADVLARRTRRWPPTSAGSRRCLAAPGCGTAASSSATGSTPTRRRTSPAAAKADPGVVATACLYRSAAIAGRQRPGSSGQPADAESSALRASASGTAFNEHYVAADGRVAQRLRDGLRAGDRLRPARRAERAQLAGDGWPSWSADNGYRISTGFAGTPYVRDALTRTGHLDDAYRLLLETGVPVVAVPGDDGRDDDLGALGLDAARRHASTRAR